MTKKEKIWLWVSAGMLIVPEILWSSIVNFYYGFIEDQPFRTNFLSNSGNRGQLIFVVLIQTLGVLVFNILLVKNRNYTNVTNGRLALFFSILINLAAFLALYVLIATRNIGA